MEFGNPLMARAVGVLIKEFGTPSRETVKVIAWNVKPDMGIVLQVDQPNREQGAFVWTPYPPDGQPVPEIALEYPGEAGRHSNTYPSPGLGRGLPALKLAVKTESELEDTISFIKALRDSMPLPEIKSHTTEPQASVPVDVSRMPAVKDKPARREAIPRVVQREVWQRDGGRCVDCGTREKLCFDHIVPFSRGGSNTIRNLQLLCERCNLSKGNRI
ncbi:MAG: HNH endonuclease signature motif containing protein [Pseudomonadota bacterium]